jgi:hypothetical protein
VHPGRTGRSASVVLRAQDARRGPVRLRDDPRPASGRVVGGEDPEALAQRPLVRAPVEGVQVTPVAAGVASQQIGYQCRSEIQQGAGVAVTTPSSNRAALTGAAWRRRGLPR